MTATVWFLLVFLPIEGSGRQVGPFASEAQCRVAERIYNEENRRYNGRPSACVQGIMR